MYDPALVLAAIDQHRLGILLLCGLAMIFNYIWFVAAVRQGIRDQVYPIPLFLTYFWLAGDGSMVLRYRLWFEGFHHWYVELFWLALVFTVICELIFLAMTLRYGQRELLPNGTRAQFVLLILAGFVCAAVIWNFVKLLIGDPLYITYFHLANIAGPPLAASLLLRRQTRAGTSTLIWVCYTLMVACWFTACALWYGEPFNTLPYVVPYVFCTATSAAVALGVSRLPPASAH